MKRKELLEQLQLNANQFADLLKQLGLEDKAWFEADELTRIQDEATKPGTSPNPSASPEQSVKEQDQEQSGDLVVTGSVGRMLNQSVNTKNALNQQMDKAIDVLHSSAESDAYNQTADLLYGVVDAYESGVVKASRQFMQDVQVGAFQLPKLVSTSVSKTRQRRLERRQATQKLLQSMPTEVIDVPTLPAASHSDS